MAPPKGFRGMAQSPKRAPSSDHQKKRFGLTFVFYFCMSERCTEPLSQKSGFKGYRDGWTGGKPPLLAPQEWINGWTEGNRDRRHGRAQPRCASLVDRPPGEQWRERK